MVYVPAGESGFATALDQLLSELGAQELGRLFYGHLCDRTEPGAGKIPRNEKLLDSVIRRWQPNMLWARARRRFPGLQVYG